MFQIFTIFVIFFSCGKLADSMSARQATKTLLDGLNREGKRNTYTSMETKDLNDLASHGFAVIAHRKIPKNCTPKVQLLTQNLFEDVYCIVTVEIAANMQIRRLVTLQLTSYRFPLERQLYNELKDTKLQIKPVDGFVYYEAGKADPADILATDGTGFQLLVDILKSQVVTSRVVGPLKVGVARNEFSGTLLGEPASKNYVQYVLAARAPKKREQK